jgi:Sulfotransferase family
VGSDLVGRLRRQDSIRDNLRAAPQRVRRGAQSAFARPNPAPIFVLGHQKSGTSAVAALLARLTGSSVTIDLLNEDRWPSYARLASGQMSFERFVRRNRLDFSRQIVKEPNLTFFYPQLRERFPQARFAIVVRDPRTNSKSILERLELPGDLAEIPPARLRSLRRGWSLMFERGWLDLPPGNYVDLLAARWNLCADLYLEHRAAFRLLRYEDFRADKQGALERLAAELGLQPCADIRPWLDRQYQPAGDQRITVGEFFGPDNLRRIESGCAARMQRLGY